MFLQEVYKHSRGLFLFMLLFVIGQLLVNYKWGLVVSPFYNYGMFSEVINIKSNYEVTKVTLNGKILRGQDFSPQQWDKIMLPIEYYKGLNSSNKLFYTDIKRLLAQFKLTANETNFLQHCNYLQFKNWYGQYLQQITQQRTNKLNIYFHLYNFDQQLKATPAMTELAQKCP